MTELEQVMSITGAKQSNCSCKTCVDMCHRAPCLGTPQDIINLVNNGYIGYLAHTEWAALNEILDADMPSIHMIQIAFDEEKGKCSLLSDDNKCLLHESGLKPTEGKLATCNIKEALSRKVFVTAHIATRWTEEIPRVVRLINAFVKYHKI